MTNWKAPFYLLIPCLILDVSMLHAQIPAFPGAEGTAAYATGGRGGTVYKVTNLDDSGAGSLRDAVSSGSRIIVFEVSGWITLNSDIWAYANNITLAGQTSPGGIGVRGAAFNILANNFIITHIRFASGAYQSDSLSVWGADGQWNGTDGDNIMVDHCSIRYGCDECVDVTYAPAKVTFSHCIIGPGAGVSGDTCHEKGQHNYGLLLWNTDSAQVAGRERLSVHHSYFVHNSFRNPELQMGVDAQDTPTWDIVNNVIWDFEEYWNIEVSRTGHANIEGNWVDGARGAAPGGDREITLYYGFTPANQFYIVGNWGSHRLPGDNPTKDDWESIVQFGGTEDLSTGYQAASRWATPGITVTRTLMTRSYASVVVANAGATKPVRDSVDLSLINDFENSVQDYVGYSEMVWPAFSDPSPPADNDNDGMADSWEEANGLNTSTDDSNSDNDGDGYVNIEEYLHYLGGYTEATDTVPPSKPLNLSVKTED